MSRGKTLELLRPDDTGRVQTIFTTEVFGCIRSLAPFRLTGASRDYVIVGSDSGRIVILEYIKEQNYFRKIHQETYGKSGCRRIVPGQYLAVDPKGRACLIGAYAGLIFLQSSAMTCTAMWLPGGHKYDPFVEECNTNCFGPNTGNHCCRGHGEAEAGLCAQSRSGSQSDHLIATGGPQVAQHCVLCHRLGHGLRQPGICSDRAGLCRCGSGMRRWQLVASSCVFL